MSIHNMFLWRTKKHITIIILNIGTDRPVQTILVDPDQTLQNGSTLFAIHPAIF